MRELAELELLAGRRELAELVLLSGEKLAELELSPGERAGGAGIVGWR